MTTTYDDYHRCLRRLKDLPAQLAADVEQATREQARAESLADKAITAADKATADALSFVESQLAVARTVLEPLDKANLVPPQIRASAGDTTATRDDMTKAQHAVAAAVNQLRQAVQDEVRRLEAENERLARESAERETLAREAALRAATEAARRKQLVKAAAIGALFLVVLVVILVIAL